ncbi:MAG: methyl-accepting chemotaxis protein [Bacteriovorax sp.]|nr:methyl-accepting chemotaxis protein [Bacteriovorax sp.]
MKTMSFRFKLILSMLAMSVVPLIATSVYSLKSSRDALRQAAFDKLVSVRESKNKSISRYLTTVSFEIQTLAHDKMMIDAAKEFMGAFKNLPAGTPEALSKLKGYYVNEFGAEYKNKTGNVSPLDNISSNLSSQSAYLQHAFISNNINPLGAKHLLDETPLLPEYSNIHKVYHPMIREFLENYALYDVFIVDIESGDIVYTVFKELDFTTNLLTGPYKDTNLAEAFKAAKQINDKKEFKIVDFKKYGPSYEAPASFIAIPIWDGNKKIAILAFQMPLDSINAIMSERSGLGETGETYLVGDDKRLRSDTHNDKEFNIFNSFNKEKLIDSSSVEVAIHGKPDAIITKNYRGVEVLSAFSKIDFPKLPWVIFAEQTVKESFVAADTILIRVVVFIVITIVVIIFISLFITSKLSNQIEEVVEAFSVSAHDVQNSSHKMGLISSKLSKSVETQISSITESAAAMEEISAMIKNNSGSARHAAELSSNSKSTALNGKEAVDKMIVEVKEISKSYDEIQESVEKNNEDINKIVQVIAEIAKKTEVINEIVFQTKLLSFNASVEAARAGDSGKGFAVVAEEIANLAAMSGKASSDIAQMLSLSQNQVKELADSTKKHIGSIVARGRLKVVSGTEIASNCMNQLDSILVSVNELDNSILEITSAINEQNTGVDEVNTAMKLLENATHNSTDMSERSKGASEDLKDQSHSLRTSIQNLRKILGAKKDYDVDPLEKSVS